MQLLKWLKNRRNQTIRVVENPKEICDSIGEKPKRDNRQNMQVPNYVHPKIMLVDLSTDAAILLREKGYNVTEACLGVPYSVPKDSGFHPLVLNAQMPQDYKEQEIVVIDLGYDRKSLEECSPTGINSLQGLWLRLLISTDSFQVTLGIDHY